MSLIRPFRAIRYNTVPESDITSRLSPPYDILDQPAKQGLLARDSRNFVAVDLPHTPPKAAGPPAAYNRARDTLQSWLTDETLIRDDPASIYVYHQHYRHAGTEFVRRMFFATLQLEAIGTGSVFPHEQTFGGPKEDRLALMKATAANLSPIFGLYQDPKREVISRLERAIASQPLAHGRLDDVDNKLWAQSDPGVVREVAELMADRPTFIADGHHRYGTALMYRDWLTAERGPLPENHPANFVLCVFCAMDDPALLILPTHRLVPGVGVPADLFRADDALVVTELAATEPEAAVRELARLGPQAVGFRSHEADRYLALTPASSDLLDRLAPDRSPAWRALGLSFLHAYVLDRVVTPKVCAGDSPAIRYIQSAADAVELARTTAGSAFLLQATTMAELRDVCQAGDLMPPKSTYFYPKLANGLVIHSLTDD